MTETKLVNRCWYFEGQCFAESNVNLSAVKAMVLG